MRNAIVVVVLLGVLSAGYMLVNTGGNAAAPAGAAAGGGRGGFGRGGFGGPRVPMTIEAGTVERARVVEQMTVVGNLIGAATVDAVPKVSGRLQSVHVQLGDAVQRGQLIAVVEDQEFRQQVKQAEASYEVAEATVRQREADLKFADTNLDRTRSLFEQELLSRQDIDDAEARHQAAVAQLDLARAQFSQAAARLEELRITLANTEIVSPVDGFVGRRHLDPGAFVSSNVPVATLVDIGIVRLVVNLVEKDLSRVSVGAAADVEVDAYPGETFQGRVARVAPILDPATRTAEMEVEIPNRDFRLKPGMYARVRLTVGERPDALVVPRNALVALSNLRGVFVFDPDTSTARFQAVTTGLEDQVRTEILDGLEEGLQVVTTGAAGLQDGDQVVLAGQAPPGGRGPRAGGRGAAGGPAAGGPAEAPERGGTDGAGRRPPSS